MIISLSVELTYDSVITHKMLNALATALKPSASLSEVSAGGRSFSHITGMISSLVIDIWLSCAVAGAILDFHKSFESTGYDIKCTSIIWPALEYLD